MIFQREVFGFNLPVEITKPRRQGILLPYVCVPKANDIRGPRMVNQFKHWPSANPSFTVNPSSGWLMQGWESVLGGGGGKYKASSVGGREGLGGGGQGGVGW